MTTGAMRASPVGARVVVVGPTNSGKTTLAERLGRAIGAPATDLDALYWKPGWVGSSDEEWRPRLRALAAEERWVIAGDYFRHTTAHVWPRAQTIVWLDLPLRVVIPRVLRRSWRRSRSRELLWGTNTERFWPQLRFWDARSLVGYALQSRRPRRERMLAAMTDPRWAHVRFIRLRSPAEVEAFARAVEAARRPPA